MVAKTGRVNVVLKPLALLVVAGSLLAGCATLPNDGATATVKRFDNVRAMRYCEVFLIGGDALTHDL